MAFIRAASRILPSCLSSRKQGNTSDSCVHEPAWQYGLRRGDYFASQQTDPQRQDLSLHNLDMRQLLTIGTDLILALDDHYSTISEHTVGVSAGIGIQLQHRFVVLALRGVSRAVIAVIVLERRVGGMRGSPRRVHVGRIEDNAVHFCVLVGQIAAIHAIGQIAC